MFIYIMRVDFTFYKKSYLILYINCISSVFFSQWHNNQWESEDNLYEKRFLSTCIYHFKPELINDMDYMRISGNESFSDL